MNVLHLLLGAVLAFSNPWSPWSPSSQGRADVPSDPTFYAVSYVEVTSSSEAKAIAALKQYRDASRTEDGPGGYIRLDVFEQTGRPGHFAIVETWRDAKASDARATARTRLLNTLQPIRASDYDERPYKTLTVAPAPPASGRTISVIAHVDVSQDPRVPVMLKRLAEESRREEGNLRFDVLQHTMRANHFTIVETWQSQKAFDAHVAAAHTRQYRDELQPLTGSPLDERVYKSVE